MAVQDGGRAWGVLLAKCMFPLSVYSMELGELQNMTLPQTYYQTLTGKHLKQQAMNSTVLCINISYCCQ